MSHYSSPKPGNSARAALFWVLINLLRLLGLAAITWAMVTHVHLLVHDIQAIQANDADDFKLAQSVDGNPARSHAVTSSADLSTIIAPPPSITKITFASAAATSSPAGFSHTAGAINSVVPNAVPNVNVGSTATDSGLPVAIFPTLASTAKQKRDEAAASALAAGASRRALPAEDSDEVSDGRFLPQSTVPNDPWGAVFAIMNHLAWVFFLLVLLPGQAGQPEEFLLAHLSALSMSSSPMWLGLGEIFAGLSLQLHFLQLQYRISGFALLCVGMINVLAIPLLIVHQRTKHTLLSNEATIYQQFACAGRFFPSRPVPPIHKGRLSKRRPSGFDRVEWANTADSLTALPEKMKGPTVKEYPTFSGQSFGDPESQIPTMTLNDDGAVMQSSRHLHDIGEEDEDSAGLHSFVTSRQPEEIVLKQGPRHLPGSGRVDSIASANAELDEMRLRVVGLNEPPQINIVSPSTIASSSRYADPRYRRPLTQYSGKSGSTQSSAASVRSESSSILRKAVPRFPAPPQRPPSAMAQVVSAEDGQGQAGVHYAARGPSPSPAPAPQDLAKEEDGEAGARRSSLDYVVSSPTAIIRQPIPVKGGLSRSASGPQQRTVRFDHRPNSTASGLEDFLPARATSTDNDSRSRQPSAHFSTFSAYTNRPPMEGNTSGEISLVSNSRYSSDRDMLPLLKQQPGHSRASSPGEGDVLQVMPADATPPPSYRAELGQSKDGGPKQHDEAIPGSGGQWFSRWRSNR